MSLRIRSIALLAVAAGTMTACKGKPPAQPPAPVTPGPAPVIDRGTSNPTPPPTNNTPVNNTPSGPTAAEITVAKNTLTATIYFDYDKADLRSDAQSTLDSKIPILQASPTVRLRIVGHTDERGSDEYNLALGQKRAATARRYLEARGVDASRFDVVSMGEAKPAMMGEGEDSWAKNRRDEFEIIAGADQVRPRR